jgi:hypothetical protein
MFLCCQNSHEKGKHVLEMFQSPQEVSSVSEEKELKLNAYIRANRPINNSKIINTISGSNKGTDLNNIMNYLNVHQDEFNDFVLKKVMKSNYESLVEEYAKTNNKWTDPDFPPEQKSFGLGKNVQKVAWKRIGDLVKNPRFMGEKVSAADILQGRIGDCYFLSAIAGLAEKDYRIKAIFPNLQTNKNGIYMARVLHKGVLQEVVVDDYFPISKKDYHIMCANPTNDSYIWVMILEKCWAKLYGSYDAIDGNFCLTQEACPTRSCMPSQALRSTSTSPATVRLKNSMKSSPRCSKEFGQDTLSAAGRTRKMRLRIWDS